MNNPDFVWYSALKSSIILPQFIAAHMPPLNVQQVANRHRQSYNPLHCLVNTFASVVCDYGERKLQADGIAEDLFAEE